MRDGFEIGNPRRAWVNSTHMAVVWPPNGAPEMPVAALKATALGLVPAVGRPAGVAVARIGPGLGGQGIEGQDKAHHQDKS